MSSELKGNQNSNSLTLSLRPKEVINPIKANQARQGQGQGSILCDETEMGLSEMNYLLE